MSEGPHTAKGERIRSAPSTHLRASEWYVQTVPTHGEVSRFVTDQHYAKGAAVSSTYRHGLYRRGDFWPLVTDLLGVALWLPAVKPSAIAVAGPDGWDGVLNLTRLAVHPDVPTNGASFLLGWSMKLIDRTRWPVLVTYADTARGHTGAIYKATNWICDGPQRPAADGYAWVNAAGKQAGRRGGVGVYRSDQQMRDMGYERVNAAPKIRFRHVQQTTVRAVVAQRVARLPFQAGGGGSSPTPRLQSEGAAGG